MSTEPGFRIEVAPQRESVRVRPQGELDLASVPLVDEELSRLRESGFSDIVLDLRGLCFMDSTGLALVIRWHRAAGQDGFSFRLVPGGEPIARLFRLTGLEPHLAFVAD